MDFDRRAFLVGLAAVVVAPSTAFANNKKRKKKRKKKSSGTKVDGGRTTHPGITRVGKNEYRIKKRLWERYVHDKKRASQLAGASQHRGRNGKPDGYKLNSIKRGDLAHAAGLRWGDVVHSVNGHNIHNPIQALSAYGKVKRARDVNVRMTRGKGSKARRLLMKYHIRA